MKNRDIKRLLKSAYAAKPSEKKADFLRSHQPRQLNYRKLLALQFRYMGPQLTALYGYALTVLLGAAAHIDPVFARLFAAMMPALALLALTGLGRSARCGMEEMETAARFSLRMVKLLRLAIIGLAGGVVMLAVACVLKIVTGADFLRSFALVCLPYLATTFFSMILIRKWHSRKNIFGCIGIAFLVCLTAFRGAELLASLSVWGLLGALSAALVLTGSEFCKYLHESEALQWNFC